MEDFFVVCSFLEDGDPGEAGLCSFEDEHFEEFAVIVEGATPLIVMIVEVEWVICDPLAAFHSLILGGMREK